MAPAFRRLTGHVRWDTPPTMKKCGTAAPAVPLKSRRGRLLHISKEFFKAKLAARFFRFPVETILTKWTESLVNSAASRPNLVDKTRNSDSVAQASRLCQRRLKPAATIKLPV